MFEDTSALRIGAAYIRVSSDDQLEYSPDSQLKVIRDYAKRDGYLIPDDLVFQDDGISGKSADKRPAFRLMIATAKESAHPFESIFVWKYSRFARNQEEAIMYKNLLKKQGVEVKSISEPSSDSPFASLIERIIEWMDEYYLINLAGEVRRGMKEKATRGEALGRAPYGYKVENKMYVPDENADTVRYIFSRYAAGVGYRALAQELIDMGVKTAKGRDPSVSMVEYTLHNPAYIGKIRWSEDGRLSHRHPDSEIDHENVVYVDGKHEPLIDMATWEIVQEKLKGRYTETKYRRRNGHMFMLKGIIRCGTCGSTLVPHDIKTGTILQCCGYARGICHVSHSIKLSKANELVLDTLRETCTADSYIFSPTAVSSPAVDRDWDKLIAAEELKMERAQEAYLAGVFDVDELRRIKSGIQETIDRLEQKRDKKETQSNEPVDLSAYHQKVLSVINIVTSPNVDEQAKNEALRSILDKIMFNRPENTFDFFFVP